MRCFLPMEQALLLKADFKLTRSKGSHRIYIKENKRIATSLHTDKTLHPKIVKQILRNVKTDK